MSSQKERTIDPADGLPASVVGDWAPDKHGRVTRYIDIYRAVRRKFADGAGATYIELFSGPGRSQIRNTNEFVDGSALAAVRKAIRTGVPFSNVYVADLDPGYVAACETRVRSLGVQCSGFVGPADETVAKITKALNPYGLHFAFLDPYDLAALPFWVIGELAKLRRIDLMIHVSAQDLFRNFRRYRNEKGQALDLFAPGWRDAVPDTEPVRVQRLQFFRFWMDLIRKTSEAMKPARGVELVTGSKNQRLYWLAFASKHELGRKFWNEIRPGRQGELFR